VAFSPDGRWVATGSDDHTVRLWDLRTGEQVGLTELDTHPKAVSFSPDGRSLFTGNANGSCYQFEVQAILTPGA
jgi:WD40 repeat protein